MSTMISQELDVSGWTIIAAAPVANILLVGIPNGWSVAIGSSPPAASALGTPVTATDGSWSSNALSNTDNVYGRPFGRQVGTAGQTITGMKN